MHTRLHNTYIGVGSSAPDSVINRAIRAATGLAQWHYKLRSDGELGISSIFEKHSPDAEIYIPYKHYNEHQSPLYKSSREAEYIASKHHLAYDGLSQEQRRFFNRYSHVVLGKDLREPALFALIYTEDAVESLKDRTSKTGYMGQIISLCQALSIPVYNLAREDSLSRMEKLLGLQLN